MSIDGTSKYGVHWTAHSPRASIRAKRRCNLASAIQRHAPTRVKRRFKVTRACLEREYHWGNVSIKFKSEIGSFALIPWIFELNVQWICGCPVEDLLLYVFVALVHWFVIFVPRLCALCVYARVSVCVQAMWRSSTNVHGQEKQYREETSASYG